LSEVSFSPLPPRVGIQALDHDGHELQLFVSLVLKEGSLFLPPRVNHLKHVALTFPGLNIDFPLCTLSQKGRFVNNGKLSDLTQGMAT
jgi:hypothetical protein